MSETETMGPARTAAGLACVSFGPDNLAGLETLLRRLPIVAVEDSVVVVVGVTLITFTVVVCVLLIGVGYRRAVVESVEDTIPIYVCIAVITNSVGIKILLTRVDRNRTVVRARCADTHNRLARVTDPIVVVIHIAGVAQSI